MELYDLLSLSCGGVSEWVEDNHSDYKLAPTQPQWKYCDSLDHPEEDDQFYWVRNNSNGNIKLCYYMSYPMGDCWQSLDNTDFSFEYTSWIVVEKPEY